MSNIYILQLYIIGVDNFMLTMDSANALNLSPEEKRAFGALFQQADTENIGVVTGEVAVKFFEKTRLDPHVLGEVSVPE